MRLARTVSHVFLWSAVFLFVLSLFSFSMPGDRVGVYAYLIIISTVTIILGPNKLRVIAAVVACLSLTCGYIDYVYGKEYLKRYEERDRRSMALRSGKPELLSTGETAFPIAVPGTPHTVEEDPSTNSGDSESPEHFPTRTSR